MPPGGFPPEFAVPMPEPSFQSGDRSKSPPFRLCFGFVPLVRSAGWPENHNGRPTHRGRGRRDDRLNRLSLLLERGLF
jgi:hypothetical protein